jgi:hypothetical protein
LTDFPRRFLVSALSPDVWCRILDFLENLEVTSLWITGSSVIRRRLGSQGGWKVLKVGNPREPPFFKEWPRWLLPQLHGLSVLHISPVHSSCLSNLLRPSIQDIMDLPKSITELKLDFVDGIRDEFLPILPPGLTQLSLPKNRSISHVGLQSLNPNIHILDLTSNLIVKDLSKLSRDLSSYTASSATITPSFPIIIGLPPTLVELKLISSNLDQFFWSMDDLALFAPHSTLSSLSISPIGPSKLDVQQIQLPQQLTSLCLSGNPKLEEFCLTSLPRSLLTLQLLFHNTNVWYDWSNDSLQHLPRTLTHLELMPIELRKKNSFSSSLATTRLSPTCLQFLPSNLITFRLLKLQVSTEEITIPQQGSRAATIVRLQSYLDLSMPYLPSSITDLYLSLRHNKATIFPSIEHLPQGLKYFPQGSVEFRRPSNGVRTIAPLATTTTTTTRSSLSKSNSSSNVVDAMLPLPPLRHANSDLPKPPPISSRKGFKVLPFIESITTGLYPALEFDHGPLLLKSTHRNQQQLESWLLNQTHPSRLRELAWVFPRLPKSINACFPSTLVSLYIECVDYQVQDEDILALPSSLTRLVVDGSMNLTDECLPALPHELVELTLQLMTEVQGHLYPFPKKLTKLSLGSSCVKSYAPSLPYWTTSLSLDSEMIYETTFTSHGFPPFLTHLKLSQTKEISGTTIRILPQTIISLEIPFLDMFDDDVEYIPRGMKRFDAISGCTNLSISSARNWPPVLTHLALHGDLFTNHAISLLPKTLKKINLCNASLIDPATIRTCLGPSIQSWAIGSSHGP